MCQPLRVIVDASPSILQQLIPPLAREPERAGNALNRNLRPLEWPDEVFKSYQLAVAGFGAENRQVQRRNLRIELAVACSF